MEVEEKAVISAEGAEVVKETEAELSVQEITYTIRVYADTREDAVAFIDDLLDEAAEVESYQEVDE